MVRFVSSRFLRFAFLIWSMTSWYELFLTLLDFKNCSSKPSLIHQKWPFPSLDFSPFTKALFNERL